VRRGCDRYLRTLLIHGARTALRHPDNPRSRWALATQARRGRDLPVTLRGRDTC